MSLFVKKGKRFHLANETTAWELISNREIVVPASTKIDIIEDFNQGYLIVKIPGRVERLKMTGNEFNNGIAQCVKDIPVLPVKRFKIPP